MTETAKKIDLKGATLYNARMEDILPTLRFDHVFTDPPYLYLKGHDFDREFDEALLFESMKRIMPDSGFSALFGRGTSFYRWNTRLAELGFIFKDEIIWDKRMISSPCLALLRIHETISLYTKKTGKIRKSKVPYVEHKQFDISAVINDIKRVASAIKSEKGLDGIMKFMESGEIACYTRTGGHKTTLQTGISGRDPASGTLRFIREGLRERSIIPVFPAHYSSLHPTQKPVRLAERVIALISDPGDTVCDPFMGSGSFGVACANTGRKYIGIETDEGYFNTAAKRIKEALSENLFAFQEGDGNA
jgi:site-specific DNA-methyltransferase (adenine-specific)